MRPSSLFLPLVVLLSACSTGAPDLPHGAIAVLPPDTTDEVDGADAGAPGGCRPTKLTQSTVIDHDVVIGCDVLAQAPLTIRDGAHVRFGLGATLIIQAGLRVEGTLDRPVMMSALDKGLRWGLVVNGGELSLKNVTISGVGRTPATESANQPAAGVFVNTAATVFVENVVVDDTDGIGWLMPLGTFARGSNHLTIQNAGEYPMFLKTRSLSDVPKGSYAHNPKPTVLVDAMKDLNFSDRTRLTTDAEIHALDVPYTFGIGDYTTDFMISTVQDGPPSFDRIPVVTVEPGAEFRFPKARTGNPSRVIIDSGLDDTQVVRPLGVLRAMGTAAAPIVFTSAEELPAPGDWATIDIEWLDPRTQLDHVVIAYAGADSGTEGTCDVLLGTAPVNSGRAAVRVFASDNLGPNHNPITNSLIAHSAGSAIFRDWRELDLDLRATNQVSDVALCFQTPVQLGGVCSQTDCL